MNEQAFLKAIFESPEDDVARMAYADWLLERGDPASTARGEFIHVQCQIARRTEGGGAPEAWGDANRLPPLKRRAQELLLAHGAEWAAQLAPLVAQYQFRRGFVEEITIDSQNFVRHAKAIMELAPVQRVRFITPWSQAVAVCPHLANLTAIDLQRLRIGDVGLRLVLASPYLQRLRSLDLSHDYLTDRGAQHLAESRVLAQLTSLNLSNNSLSLKGVQALYESPYWPRLTQFTLTGNSRVDARALQFLGQTLQGSGDPALLRSLLQMASREEREYTCSQVRTLAEEAAADPARATEVLVRGLGASYRKQRAAAAQMLARLGPEAALGLPALVQRLFEANPLVRDHVAPALARILPTLSAPLQGWLCLLANPLLSPLANLRNCLQHAKLPDPARQEFAKVCARRLSWWAHIAAGNQGPAPVPDLSALPLSTAAILKVIQNVIESAQRAALKHVKTEADRKSASELARDKEAAWLLARLCEQLQAVLPPPPVPEPSRPSRARKK